MNYRESYNRGRPTKTVLDELNLKICDIVEIIKKYNISYSEYTKNREMYIKMYKMGFQGDL